MKPIEQRKLEFWHDISDACGWSEDKYTFQEQQRFYLYWSQHKKPVRSNTKMLFEKQPVFDMMKRFATRFKSNPKRYAKKRHLQRQTTINKLMGL